MSMEIGKIGETGKYKGNTRGGGVSVGRYLGDIKGERKKGDSK